MCVYAISDFKYSSNKTGAATHEYESEIQPIPIPQRHNYHPLAFCLRVTKAQNFYSEYIFTTFPAIDVSMISLIVLGREKPGETKCAYIKISEMAHRETQELTLVVSLSQAGGSVFFALPQGTPKGHRPPGLLLELHWQHLGANAPPPASMRRYTDVYLLLTD